MVGERVDIKSLIRTIPDYPKAGILFRDITTLIADPAGLRDGDRRPRLAVPHRAASTIVAGIEARGFILGGAVAHELGRGFVPIRKKGKLPLADDRAGLQPRIRRRHHRDPRRRDPQGRAACC